MYESIDDITEEHYQTALENGIPRHLVIRRVRDDAWTIKRSITQKPKNNYGLLVKVAVSNGISYHSFYSRIKRGMDPFEAATAPIKETGKRKHKKKVKQKLL